MDVALATTAAIAATVFTLDLGWDLRRGFRPHTAAYAVGIGMFAVATWALAAGLGTGWTGASYRTFFLFGAVLNIPYLALGSMFIVVGRRSGNVMALILGGFSAIAITLVTTAAFARELPDGGIPHDIFPSIPEVGFGPRLLAAIGGGTGASLLILLALVSLLRFWRRDRRLVWGSGLIMAGTMAAAWGGTGLAFGEAGSFAVSLMLAALLLWLGHRTMKGRRRRLEPPPLVVLVGPSTESPERAHAELMISALEGAGYRVMCPARDIEGWGDVGFSPEEVMRRTFESVEEAAVVVVDLAHGYGTVTAGYARAVGIPVVVAAPSGDRIPRPLKGIAASEVYYHLATEVADHLSQVMGITIPGTGASTGAPARV